VTCLAKPQAIASQGTLDGLFVGEANLKLLQEAYTSSQAWQAADAGHVADGVSPDALEATSDADYL
jgi:hypothetical protein